MKIPLLKNFRRGVVSAVLLPSLFALGKTIFCAKKIGSLNPIISLLSAVKTQLKGYKQWFQFIWTGLLKGPSWAPAPQIKYTVYAVVERKNGIVVTTCVAMHV